MEKKNSTVVVREMEIRKSGCPVSLIIVPLKVLLFFQVSSASLHRTVNLGREALKEAMSPSEAESLRATFAAFLWQEGIVHDAMACASFLKFHPNLPKEGATVVTRRAPPTQGASTDHRHMQRHSVEVSTSGNKPLQNSALVFERRDKLTVEEFFSHICLRSIRLCNACCTTAVTAFIFAIRWQVVPKTNTLWSCGKR